MICHNIYLTTIFNIIFQSKLIFNSIIIYYYFTLLSYRAVETPSQLPPTKMTTSNAFPQRTSEQIQSILRSVETVSPTGKACVEAIKSVASVESIKNCSDPDFCKNDNVILMITTANGDDLYFIAYPDKEKPTLIMNGATAEKKYHQRT